MDGVVNTEPSPTEGTALPFTNLLLVIATSVCSLLESVLLRLRPAFKSFPYDGIENIRFSLTVPSVWGTRPHVALNTHLTLISPHTSAPVFMPASVYKCKAIHLVGANG